MIRMLDIDTVLMIRVLDIDTVLMIRVLDIDTVFMIRVLDIDTVLSVYVRVGILLTLGKHLFCLFFDLRILNTSLISSNSSCMIAPIPFREI